jgi:MFS family permease
VLIRAFLFGLTGASIAALTPLVARNLLKGDASTYGLLLGANGVGAVIGALIVSAVRNRFKAEHAVSCCAIVGSLMIVLIALSHSITLTAGVMAVAGTAFMLNIALLNVGVQLSAPRWVTARAIAWFQSALTGGIAVGAWMWGQAAADWDVSTALSVSGIALAVTPFIGLILPMPPVSLTDVEMVEQSQEPEVALAVTARSGPIVIEIDYRVDPPTARDFYDVMLKMQRTRLRNGAFDWSLSRDIAEPELWTERFHCPTWADYLRMRSRFTHSDRELQNQANAFHSAENSGPRVRRRLERPFGSVRWRAETPDPRRDPINIYTP